MPAHCVQVITPGATTRRVSFAAEVVGIGGNEGVATTTTPFQNKRQVSFAADVEMIRSSETDVPGSHGDETMTSDVDMVFNSENSTTADGGVADIVVHNNDGIEGVSVSGETSQQTSNGTQEAALVNTEATNDVRSRPARLLALPPRNSSLKWQRHQGQPGQPPFLKPLAVQVPPRRSHRASIPRSPPPPYADDDMTADRAEGAEILANRDPLPGYDDDDPSPPYTIAFLQEYTLTANFERYTVHDDDIILEDVFGGVGRWVAGLRDGFMNAFGGLRYGSTDR